MLVHGHCGVCWSTRCGVTVENRRVTDMMKRKIRRAELETEKKRRETDRRDFTPWRVFYPSQEKRMGAYACVSAVFLVTQQVRINDCR